MTDPTRIPATATERPGTPATGTAAERPGTPSRETAQERSGVPGTPGEGERHIRTFHPRRGRMSARHHDAFAELWPAYGITVVDGDRSPLNLGVLFGREAPRVLEIGFGMGDATAAMAAADPGRDYLAAEVHTPGIGNLLALAGDLGLTNVRIAHGDAMELVHRLVPGSLDAVHVFFPDPWPKVRHHKRRLIRAGTVGLLVRVLRAGGLLHCATDWPHYAESMRAVLDAEPGLRPAGPDASARSETKFERRAREAGRSITDLVYERA
jgi:tRNA (guanine-N7-)-methyltransferase